MRTASRTRRRRPGSRRHRTAVRTPSIAWQRLGTRVRPFSRNGGPSVTCWVQPIGPIAGGQVLDRSRGSSPRGRAARSGARAGAPRAATRARIDIAWPVTSSSYRTTDASPCGVSPAAASSSDGPPKMSTHRLCPMMPASSFASAPEPYSVCVARDVGRRLDRLPRRRPQRVDARSLVEDLGDVAALFEDRRRAPRRSRRSPARRPRYSCVDSMDRYYARPRGARERGRFAWRNASRDPPAPGDRSSMARRIPCQPRGFSANYVRFADPGGHLSE